MPFSSLVIRPSRGRVYVHPNGETLVQHVNRFFCHDRLHSETQTKLLGDLERHRSLGLVDRHTVIGPSTASFELDQNIKRLRTHRHVLIAPAHAYPSPERELMRFRRERVRSAKRGAQRLDVHHLQGQVLQLFHALRKPVKALHKRFRR